MSSKLGRSNRSSRAPLAVVSVTGGRWPEWSSLSVQWEEEKARRIFDSLFLPAIGVLAVTLRKSGRNIGYYSVLLPDGVGRMIFDQVIRTLGRNRLVAAAVVGLGRRAGCRTREVVVTGAVDVRNLSGRLGGNAVWVVDKNRIEIGISFLDGRNAMGRRSLVVQRPADSIVARLAGILLAQQLKSIRPSNSC